MRTLQFLNEAERRISAPQPRPSLILIEDGIASEMWWDGIPGRSENVKVRVHDLDEYLDQFQDGDGRMTVIIADELPE
ncbi:hypothetical protein LTH96_03085 [Nesterenkonia sp. LB17]|uniref:hypothetical protein n=1 Tax=Nesterenkonia sp. LB17 TaxID=2901230 RepID=UPI001F4CB9A7|nr:hypothetical protein [Nesterenkonia sp. LB17]MCH8564729.1 hypothetical protein [Nesterenkonia sp. LB17]